MKRISLGALVLAAWIAADASAFAAAPHFWRITSPDHEQTFVYGTETNRVWAQWGRDRHLALLLDFTNDPYVDYQNPRQYDNFRFDFRSVRLGPDGRVFYYHTSDGPAIPVAVRHPDFLGIDEIRLLPNAAVDVERPHGYITVILNVLDPQ